MPRGAPPLPPPPLSPLVCSGGGEVRVRGRASGRGDEGEEVKGGEGRGGIGFAGAGSIERRSHLTLALVLGAALRRWLA